MVTAIRFAFAFPDLYEVGMSHLGMKILYSLLNEQPDIYCERVFAPWTDMEEMRKHRHPPVQPGNHGACANFDFLGSPSSTKCATPNILNTDRRGPHAGWGLEMMIPWSSAGTLCVCNPEPLADFFDLVVGEGEEVLLELMDSYRAWKASADRWGKPWEWLRQAAGTAGIYAPGLYSASYHDDGTIAEFVGGGRGFSGGHPQALRPRFECLLAWTSWSSPTRKASTTGFPLNLPSAAGAAGSVRRG